METRTPRVHRLYTHIQGTPPDRPRVGLPGSRVEGECLERTSSTPCWQHLRQHVACPEPSKPEMQGQGPVRKVSRKLVSGLHSRDSRTGRKHRDPDSGTLHFGTPTAAAAARVAPDRGRTGEEAHPAQGHLLRKSPSRARCWSGLRAVKEAGFEGVER